MSSRGVKRALGAHRKKCHSEGDRAPLLSRNEHLIGSYGRSVADDDRSSAESHISKANSKESSVPILDHGLFQNLRGSLLPSETEVVRSGGETGSKNDVLPQRSPLRQRRSHVAVNTRKVAPGYGVSESDLSDRGGYESFSSSNGSYTSQSRGASEVLTNMEASKQRGERHLSHVRRMRIRKDINKNSQYPSSRHSGTSRSSKGRGGKADKNSYRVTSERPPTHEKRVRRSLRRRIYLLLTEPQSSIGSAAFFILLIVLIAASNVVMMMETMDEFCFTPKFCDFCGGPRFFLRNNASVLVTLSNDETNCNLLPHETSNGTASYLPWMDDTVDVHGGTTATPGGANCQCPPTPFPNIVFFEDALIYFFTVEWCLRVLCYSPPIDEIERGWRSYVQWLSYLTDASVILDALAIFPYYVERFEESNALLSLRLARLFRVFQLLRLGQYNATFSSLSNVFVRSIQSLNVLLIVLVFCAAFFGSMIYWLEKGEWKYTDFTNPPSFRFMRSSSDGSAEEPSPFISIPVSFWWFIVTATTVGYGDFYPTSLGGKLVAGAAMLLGVLVIAFPVSIFSDLWSRELKKSGAIVEYCETSFSLENAESEMKDDSILRFVTNAVGVTGTQCENEGQGVDARDINLPVDSVDQSFRKKESKLTLQPFQIEDLWMHLRRIEESERLIKKILNECQVAENQSCKS